jgi:isoleucyl-tRNA synthetase
MEHKLPILSPVDDHGRYTDEAGLPGLTGKYVFEANADIVALLREKGMLISEAVYRHSYPYCWRSKTPIIFRAVEQFFIRIDDLRADALAAIKGVHWIPPWGENRISGTVESRPDWVISRQRSWGVPLPVFYSAEGETILDPKWIRKLADVVAQRGSNVWFELDDTALARELGLPEGTRHRTDTIDVWIDSGVSHAAVLATNPELRDPADMYLEATDQHRGWFQSSLMTSIALHNRSPYKTCVTHGFVVDVDGKKISKSSSYSKPMDAGHFVAKHGADIVRLWVSSINYADDVPFSEEMFTRLGDTYRRIRNTLRILLGNLHESGTQEARKEDLTLVDRWILDRLENVIGECRAAYAAYEFHKVYHILNQFCAVDLSSLYIDITKDRMYCDAADAGRRRATQMAMRRIFDALCRLLAPILVFTAEEAWGYLGEAGSVHVQTFPDESADFGNPGHGNWTLRRSRILEGLLGWRRGVAVETHEHVASRLAHRPVDRQPVGDRPQPAAEAFRFAKLIDLFQRVHEHFLAQLLGFAVVAEPAQSDGVDHRLKPRGQFAECIPVAGLRGLDQVFQGGGFVFQFVKCGGHGSLISLKSIAGNRRGDS